MTYRAIVDFKDLLSGVEYKAGEKYPREGEADAKRIEQLSTPTSQRGPLIEEYKAKMSAEEILESASAAVPVPTRRKKKEK